ncbi:2Fe-2S iron-sulfur cluster-binding protein [Glaciihabitans sp. UYNi722]|uniref:2Fe-2S iron-sulfur cluster-binding protein n=1 Tax=Glaciihabitans sp. UYNi722 TaxID=3156344 RepID=UPI0033993DB9
MTKIVYTSAGGAERHVDATIGDSVMSTAVKNGVTGIVAECGGNCTCGTCHVYVDPEFMNIVGAPTGIEVDMLEMAVSDPRGNSRLSCQIRITSELDGLRVTTPETQP